jgi:hypothetical protein
MMGFAHAQPILRSIERQHSYKCEAVRERLRRFKKNLNGLFAYQQGTQRQHRGAQALTQPGPQPQ